MKLKKGKKDKKKAKEEDLFSRDYPEEEEDFHDDGFDSQLGKRGMSPHRRDVEMRSGSRYSNGYSSDQQSDSNDEGPTFLLEHLATFSVGQQHVSPKDGLKRLLLMEKSNGIWTQKMQLRLEKKWVVIIDYENGDVVERFPMSLINEPTAYTSNDPRELYNNILVYIVREDPKNKNQTPAEMHIFQCVRVSAQEVVDELKMFISGKWKPGFREGRHILPPPNNAPLETPSNGIPSPSVNVREQVSMFNATASGGAGPPHAVLHRPGSSQGHRPDRATIYPRETSNDETSSTSSDKYERDVAILNHCFDDIERFIARLQHAAAAYKELERRRKTRKTKKKDMGDGMLSMRAKPPPEREFVDILQKFKLSFNLLAKLKSHIHDPNAPELIHFLFTPLALIVDAARDSNYGPNIASKVVTPLLTRDAIDLLLNCCTSKESDLWHSLGDPWSIPRESWKGYQGSYHPVFSDGWAPEYPFTEERERAEVTAAAAASEAQRVYRDKIIRAQQEEKDSRYGSEYYYSSERPVTPDRMHPQAYDNNQYDSHPMELGRREVFPESRNRGRSPPSEFSTDSIDRLDPHNDPQHQFELQQQQWAEDLKARGAKVVQVMYPRTANNDKELSVIRGEVLEILDDSRKWWKARNIRGQVAHVPHTIVSPCSGPGGGEEDIFNNPLYVSRGPMRDPPYYSPSDSPSGRDDSSPSHPSPGDHPHRHSTIPPPVPASADWVRRERQGKKEPLNNRQSKNIETNNNTHSNHNGKEEFPAPPPSFLNQIAANNSSHSEPKPPPPNPPPPPPPESLHPKVTSLKPTKPLKSIQKKPKKFEETEPINLFHEELKERVTLRPKTRKVWGNHKEHLSNNYLTPESTPDEVQDWIVEKGFSDRASKACKDLTGIMMFSLTRAQLEKTLGFEEGPRLHSHLTVQKNICGFKSFKEHELSSILEERRRKVETKKQKAEVNSPNPQEMIASMSLSSEDEEDLPDPGIASKTLRVLLKEQRRKIMDARNIEM